jgi:hypothetical protein
LAETAPQSLRDNRLPWNKSALLGHVAPSRTVSDVFDGNDAKIREQQIGGSGGSLEPPGPLS